MKKLPNSAELLGILDRALDEELGVTIHTSNVEALHKMLYDLKQSLAKYSDLTVGIPNGGGIITVFHDPVEGDLD